jgi:hypothetical protein
MVRRHAPALAGRRTVEPTQGTEATKPCTHH